MQSSVLIIIQKKHSSYAKVNTCIRLLARICIKSLVSVINIKFFRLYIYSLHVCIQSLKVDDNDYTSSSFHKLLLLISIALNKCMYMYKCMNLVKKVSGSII